MTYQQLHIDLGQKNVGVVKCKECEMEWDPARPDEVSLHRKYHQSITGGIKFNVYHISIDNCENRLVKALVLVPQKQMVMYIF